MWRAPVGVPGYFQSDGGPLGWVTFRLNPMELRKKEYFLTDMGRALVHQFEASTEQIGGALT